ncbi:MAG: DUF4124 domain-containing protein [Sutterellaceae bacterium]|nr:DUF4124 domain-containing protein [Burkholderiaceae bacterium]MCX7901058.1 DUF4124 domain-containing protein [Burkholderiaceae bacterium]MDW8431049.1 DUF4124 domain-containing protein [Sutterellaceae bacterium]
MTAGCLMLAMPALAQWAWRDENGRVVYSDRPPPANVKNDRILRQPAVPALGVPVQEPKSDAKGEGKVQPKSLAERELEFRKRQQERAEAERQQVEAQTREEARLRECDRMRGYLRALEEGERVVRVDAKGHREFLEDAQRASEITRVREALARSCSPSG